MNLNEAKEIFSDNSFRDAFTYYDSFLEWIGKKENAEMTDTFKSIEAGIEQIEKNLDDIDKRCNRFMSACDSNYPRHYPRQKSKTTKEKQLNYSDYLIEKSDAGKLADKFTELLKKK